MRELRRLLLEGPPAVRMVMLGVMVMLVAVAPAMAGSYAWVGDMSGSGGWSTQGHWVRTPPFCTTLCYPRTTDDDATIDAAASNTTISLSENVTIDDLTLDAATEGVTLSFTAGGTPYVVSTDSVAITSVNAVTMTTRAGIVTNGALCVEEEE